MIELSEAQLKAINKMHNGCILCGGVGSGKSRTSLGYYFEKVCHGHYPLTTDDSFSNMEEPRDLYIITTAKKRDSKEWEKECQMFHLFVGDPDNTISNINIVVDSWNNIKKYTKVYQAFFIFDEQRVVGYGEWTKSFLKIANKNRWVLLSATPGDVWKDYMPVFIANGFYKNKTDFCNKHVIWARNAKYPKIDGYYDQGILVKHRKDLLVTIDSEKDTVRHSVYVTADYDKGLYKQVWKDRWDVFNDCPIKESGKLFSLIRRVVNSDPDRILQLTKLLEDNPKTIIFYNYDYELELIRQVLDAMMIPYSEWNGKKHMDILDGDQWAYVVQYTAGNEGWNCTTTNVEIMYSLNYSYRITEQAMGRIDRMNTKYKDLYYYIIRSRAPIDIAIKRALADKRNFNEKAFLLSNSKS